MQSTLTSRETDPHDIFAIEPDVVLAARADKSPSDLVHDILSRSSSPQAHISPIWPRPPRLAHRHRRRSIRRFAATNVNSILGERPSERQMGEAVIHGPFALCSAVAAAGWQHYGDEAKQMIASWTPSFALSSLLHTETPAVAEQPGSPAVQVSSQASSQTATADQAAAQPVSAQPVSQTQPPATAAPAVTSADSAQMLQSMARDLATMGQQIEQLKANIEQIKASQEQISRSAARTAEIKPAETRPVRDQSTRAESAAEGVGVSPRPALHPCAGRGLHIRPRKPLVSPALPRAVTVSRRCSLSRRRRNGSAGRDRGAATDAPAISALERVYPSAGTRRAQTEGWSDPVCCLIRPRISHALRRELRRVIRLRGLDS